jgi:YihY family inner membrane protein
LARATAWNRILAPALRYLLTTEAHVYAFAMAANFLLSFMPFTVLLLSLCRKVLHSRAGYDAVLAVLRDALPAGQEFIARNLQAMVYSRGKVQIFSLVFLLFTSTGVLLPLEVALNRVWRFPNDRSFVRNQAVSFALALACGSLAFLSVILTGSQRAAIVSLGTQWLWLGWLVMKLVALSVTILIFFLLYYFLPNGPVPLWPMLRAAAVIGLLMEIAKYAYMGTLPWLNFRATHGPFAISVTLVVWAFLGSLILLAGAHVSAFQDGRLGRR